MPDQMGSDLCKIQQQLENDRSNWDNHWSEIAQRVLPHEDNFNSSRTPGQKLMDKVFDATAILALGKFSSAIDSIVTPASQVWHGLGPDDDALADNLEVKQFLEHVVKIMFKVRYRPFANFASQVNECWISLGAFGTCVLFTDDILGRGIRYSSIPMPQAYFRQSAYGIVDYFHRKFELDIRQIVQKFGESNVPDEVKKYEASDPFKKFDVIHCVRPNDEYKQGERTHRGMRWASEYVLKEQRMTLQRGGYRTFPYAVGRYTTSSKEVYGRGPAMTVLPDIKMLNEMEKTMLRAAHKQVDPPLMAYGDGILSAFNARPNAINYGAVNEQGQQLIHPLQTGARLPIGLEMTDQKRKVINDAFLVTLFQILVEHPQMTATEALLRAQEKGALLAPTMGRQQSEFLGAIIPRELDILSRAGVTGRPPDALRSSGSRVAAVYTSPLSRLRRAEDAVAIVRTLEVIRPIAEIKPEVLDNFADDAMVRELAEINGVPSKILNSMEKVAAIRQERAEAAAAQAEVQQAREASVALKNTAQAGAVLNEMVPEEGMAA